VGVVTDIKSRPSERLVFANGGLPVLELEIELALVLLKTGKTDVEPIGKVSIGGNDKGSSRRSTPGSTYALPEADSGMRNWFDSHCTKN
jgi:hypothetical protein